MLTIAIFNIMQNNINMMSGKAQGKPTTAYCLPHLVIAYMTPGHIFKDYPNNEIYSLKHVKKIEKFQGIFH